MEIVFWEMQVALAFCFLVALSPMLSPVDFLLSLVVIVSAALLGIWR